MELCVTGNVSWSVQWTQQGDADGDIAHSGVLSGAVGAVFAFWWEYCAQCSIGRVKWVKYLEPDRYTAHSGVLRVAVFAVFGYLWVYFTQCSSQVWSGFTICILMGTVRTLQYWGLKWALYLDTDKFIPHSAVLRRGVCAILGCWWYIAHSWILSGAVVAVFDCWWAHCAQRNIEGYSVRSSGVLYSYSG